jgi:hypothetical protein
MTQTTRLARKECTSKLEIQLSPLASFMKYISKLNPENNAFWQQPSDSYTDTSNVWYTRTPLGKTLYHL